MNVKLSSKTVKLKRKRAVCDKTVDLGALPNGAHLFRKPNGAGGYTYYSDEIGGGVTVWDTCLVAESTLLAAMACEHHRVYLEYMIEKRGWKPTPEMEVEQMAATGGMFASPELIAEIARRKEEEAANKVRENKEDPF